ncbi:MAG: lytic transglycosylase domain-containing protein, partial [Alphaproteobacteria bacterium]
DSIPDAEVLAWFSRREPRTVKGRMHLARALLATGKREQATALLRETWVNGNFPRRQERSFLRRYRKFLRKEDHVARLDRLLWAGRSWEARRLLRRVEAGQRALAVARIRLRRFRGGVDSAIQRVPKALIDDPGLVYERLRWRRRKGRDEDARALLENPPQDLVRPGAWWIERGVLARRALKQGEISIAYRLARDHQQTSGVMFAEAEWLAGWIALRFLEDSEDALRHFTALYENVRFPISLARGAYWAGRAAEAKGDTALAQEWYAKAARHFTTFYGQLAEARLDGKALPVVPKDPQPGADEAVAFANNELVRAAKLMGLSADREHLGRFILHLNKKARTPAEHALIASLAASQNRPDLAVAAAKRSLRRGVYLLDAAYPAYPLPRDRDGLEPELLLALLRQESAFDIAAISDAGARGLMQLLPSTARIVARQLKLGYSTRKLTTDAEYNMTLGAAYLARLLDQFAGSYVLALAAYNGGPTRVRRWLRANGDPRRADVDVIDWIELIPFDETRDYVQRVLENLQVYRARNGRSYPGVTLDRDLNR